jgi:hypothetical protein
MDADPAHMARALREDPIDHEQRLRRILACSMGDDLQRLRVDLHLSTFG